MDDDIRDRISLYLYGELSVEDRQRFEQEMEASPDLAAEVEAERAFFAVMETRPEAQLPAGLLAECRHDLMREVYRDAHGAAAAEPKRTGWFESWMAGLAGMRIAWQPTAALALLALGFWGGRATQQALSGSADPRPSQAAIAGPDLGAVESIDFDAAAGNVEIVLQAERTLRGAPNDPVIRGLLISNVRSPNSGVRMETVEALRPRSEDEEIRQALIQAMLEDPNPGVRLKALDALAEHGRRQDVRQALVEALRSDQNTGVRVQAVDLLTAHPDREIVGDLQQLVLDEPNPYVRLQCQRILQELNASVGQY